MRGTETFRYPDFSEFRTLLLSSGIRVRELLKPLMSYPVLYTIH